MHDCQSGFGQGRYVIELVRRLAARYRLSVFSNRFDPELPPGAAYHRIPALRTNALLSILSFLLASELRMRRARCDIIHAQGLTSWSADLITAHICNAARFADHSHLSIVRSLFPTIIIPLERAFYRSRRPKGAIVMSQALAGELASYYGWNRTVTIIPHGTDTALFRPCVDEEERLHVRSRYRLGPRDWVWLFLGEAAKGLEMVIRQLPHFPAARLLVVSRSNPEAFLTLASGIQAAERVVWYGPESQPELAYRAADVFVYPSGYDAFGMVVTEAMASGLPVIAGRRIGAAELIRDQSNGLLVDASDGDGVRVALRRIGSEPGFAGVLAAAGRATICGHSWDACATRTAEVYDSLARARNLPAMQSTGSLGRAGDGN